MIKSRPRSSWFTKVSITLTVYNNATVCVPVPLRLQKTTMLFNAQVLAYESSHTKMPFLRLFFDCFLFHNSIKAYENISSSGNQFSQFNHEADTLSAHDRWKSPVFNLGRGRSPNMYLQSHNFIHLYIRWQQILKSRGLVPCGLIVPNIVS